MINNFLVSWNSLVQGRIWTVVTSVFSHSMLLHIFLNMFVLFNFGIIVENYLGQWRFFIFYLVAGMSGSLMHTIVCAFILNQPNVMALGASGAISGVLILFALLNPKEIIFLFGIIPLPAIWAAILFMGIDAYGLFNQARGVMSPIGYGAHLGGAMVGIIYYFVIRLSKIN